MIFLILISICYLTLIMVFIWGLAKVPTFKLKSKEELTKFSIIIPFRDEEKDLPDLIQSLIALNYKRNLFEVIFIDDESTDHSYQIINKLAEFQDINYQIFNNQRSSSSPKKDAIRLAVTHAQHPWVITTDADCILPNNWLKSYDQFIQNHDAAMIIAPVTIKNDASFLSNFQAIDILSLQGISMGSFGIEKPMLCNGANLAYQKRYFEAIRPYDRNDTFASGDDIFLLYEMYALYPYDIHYLKSNEVIVKTSNQSNLNALIQQRVRWASKTSATRNSFTQWVAAMVILMNLTFIIAIGLLFSSYQWIGIMILVSKMIIDYILIHQAAKILRVPLSPINYLLSAFCYPFFTIFVLLSSLTGKFIWKERTYKN